MNRNFGLTKMTRTRERVQPPSGPSSGIRGRVPEFHLPSGSILVPPEPSFERGEVEQSLIDISFVLTVSLMSVALGCAVYLLVVIAPFGPPAWPARKYR